MNLLIYKYGMGWQLIFLEKPFPTRWNRYQCQCLVGFISLKISWKKDRVCFMNELQIKTLRKVTNWSRDFFKETHQTRNEKILILNFSTYANANWNPFNSRRPPHMQEWNRKWYINKRTDIKSCIKNACREQLYSSLQSERMSNILNRFIFSDGQYERQRLF